MLNTKEKIIADQIRLLKKKSGTHSPSIFSIVSQIPELEIKIDACFLSNPYATDLFMDYFQRDLIETGKIRELLEFYPTQNRQLASLLAPVLGVSAENIILGNGATEIIQAILHRFTKKKLLVILPTFSPYYEFARPDTEIVFFKLEKAQNFALDADAWLDAVKTHRPDTVVIINPNNPDGGYIPVATLRDIFGSLAMVENIVLDESFLHFAFENADFSLISNKSLIQAFPNVMTIKSMSKDFGIAGIRAGYAVMAKEKVDKLLNNGYLWNINGLAEYFFRLFATEKFREQYEVLRIKHVKETQNFYEQLSNIPSIKAYASKSNFFLVDLGDANAAEVALELLIRYGIYTRSCEDKKGLEGNFIRIASRTNKENLAIVDALNKVIPSHSKCS